MLPPGSPWPGSEQDIHEGLGKGRGRPRWNHTF